LPRRSDVEAPFPSQGAPRGCHLRRFRDSWALDRASPGIPKSPKMARPPDAICPYSPRHQGAGADAG
jgi:hypothetical protein